MSSSERFDADFIIIGSGFGGSVSALRLVEKGYRVIVLEAGKRWAAKDFPKTNWLVHKYLWAPKLGFYGIQKLSLLKDVLILSGAGVGGGSLVYANTLLVPPRAFFADPRWGQLEDWERTLGPHYETAKRMLGATPSKFIGPADRVLREIAEESGRGETFHQPTVAVFFGEPDKTVADPYFGGQGPERTGCNYCGSCMVGCRVGAKNTLDKNYLYLAEKAGAQVFSETTVDDVRPIEGGYEVASHRTTSMFKGGKRTFRAPRVIFAGGVMGTVRLLLECKERGSLPKLSPRLGDYVRTNSEALVGATSRRFDEKNDHSRGIAITSGFYPEDDTHIEVVRYGKGQDAMSRLATLMVDGGKGRWRRFGAWLGSVVRNPLDFLRTLWPFGWAQRSTILLVMQTVDNHIRMKLARPWWWPFGKVLSSEVPSDQERPPTYLPIANLTARKFANKIGGFSASTINEAFLDVPTTAHILGGCCIGATAEEGVIDLDHQVHGHPGLYVCDGSAISANLGVNPSLTICAMTERAMSRISPK